MKRLIAAAFLAVGFVACSSTPPPEVGTVLHKQYIAAWVETDMVCVYFGKYGCSIYVPETTQHDQEWDVYLDGKDHSGKRRTGWIAIEQAVFDACERGQWYANGKCTAQ